MDYFDSRMFDPIGWFFNWNSSGLGSLIVDKSVTLFGDSAIGIGIGFGPIDIGGS